jgi:hypothetical protein
MMILDVVTLLFQIFTVRHWRSQESVRVVMLVFSSNEMLSDLLHVKMYIGS